MFCCPDDGTITIAIHLIWIGAFFDGSATREDILNFVYSIISIYLSSLTDLLFMFECVIVMNQTIIFILLIIQIRTISTKKPHTRSL